MSLGLPMLRGLSITGTAEKINFKVIELKQANWNDILQSEGFNLVLAFAAPFLFLGALVSLVSTPLLYAFYRAMGWWEPGVEKPQG